MLSIQRLNFLPFVLYTDIKKLSISNDDLKFKVSFDISINLDSNKSYKANMSLELPVGNVVDDGIQSQENTDFKNLVFKRM